MRVRKSANLNLLVRRTRRVGAEPGRVLEDALRAGVVNELPAPDETLLHQKSAPGAKAIRKVGWGWRARYRWSDMSHVGILSDRREPCQSIK
jgi:hypothetical protein